MQDFQLLLLLLFAAYIFYIGTKVVVMSGSWGRVVLSASISVRSMGMRTEDGASVVVSIANLVLSYWDGGGEGWPSRLQKLERFNNGLGLAKIDPIIFSQPRLMRKCWSA